MVRDGVVLRDLGVCHRRNPMVEEPFKEKHPGELERIRGGRDVWIIRSQGRKYK